MPGFDLQLDRDHLLRLDLLELKDLVLPSTTGSLSISGRGSGSLHAEWAQMFPWNLSAHLVPLPIKVK